MIRSLDDAWKWYMAVRTLAFDMKRLARKWDDPALAEVLGRDNHLRHRTTAELQDMAQTILDELDDLSVLVLFSIFEATVRAQAMADVDREITLIRHPAVLRVVKDLREAIENGELRQGHRGVPEDGRRPDCPGQPGSQVRETGSPTAGVTSRKITSTPGCEGSAPALPRPTGGG